MRTDGSTVSESPVHRYFPEWADRPTRDGVSPDSERNSYDAGGYAEEFGYCWQHGMPLLTPTLEDDPESSSQWRVFIGCLHPGYPECSKPLAREGDSAEPYPDGGRPAPKRFGSSSAGPSELRVIRVDEIARRKNRLGGSRLWRMLRIQLRGL